MFEPVASSARAAEFSAGYLRGLVYAAGGLPQLGRQRTHKAVQRIADERNRNELQIANDEEAEGSRLFDTPLFIARNLSLILLYEGER
jgi:hypothetical protein